MTAAQKPTKPQLEMLQNAVNRENHQVFTHGVQERTIMALLGMGLIEKVHRLRGNERAEEQSRLLAAIGKIQSVSSRNYAADLASDGQAWRELSGWFEDARLCRSHLDHKIWVLTAEGLTVAKVI